MNHLDTFCDPEYWRFQEVRVTGKLLFEKESYLIRGAAYAVYKEMGCGFLESVFQECLCIEFRKQSVPFVSQYPLELYYCGEKLKQHYVADFLCFDRILLEIKAVREISNDHRAQLQNYLRASRLSLGLLMNFGAFPGLVVERIAATSPKFQV